MRFLRGRGLPKNEQLTRVWMAVTSAAVALCAAAQTPPPAPSLVAPASGASLAQPIVLDWSSVEDPDGPIGSYVWQIATSSTFSTIIAEGAQNVPSDTIPIRTEDKLSGLPNGTYFWRVKANQMVDGTFGSLESPWSPVRSFTVTGLGPAPATPSFTSPANGAAFHPFESFSIIWSRVPDAHYYLLEADDEPSFSHPLTLTTESMHFGTKFGITWGNELNIYYRVRAVSADNVRGLPSPTLNVRIVNTAPVPPAPTPLAPTGGASVSIPIRFDWTDSPNAQIGAYDLDIDDEPNFEGTIGVVLVQSISRSDYMLAEDPEFQLQPGTYFWRVRAVHGSAFGPWSAGTSFNVTAPPPTPPGLELFWIINEPGSVYGGNPTQARITLNMPAGPGGALVHIASDLPHSDAPATVLVPESRTDAWVSPVTSVPVGGATIGRLRAAYGQAWQQSSIGLFPILWGLSLSAQAATGGGVLTGTVTLLNPAPTGGIEVTLVSSDPEFVPVPGKIFIPQGEMGATFVLPTAPVSEPRRIVMNSGTALEGYRAPETWLTLLPEGSPPPPASLSALELAHSSIPGETTTIGTVTLTAPAPAGGAQVRLSGSMEGQVVTPQNVTVPEGSISANFTITAPQVNTHRYVLIQARYGSAGGSHAKLLEIVPAAPGEPTLLAVGVRPRSIIGGNSTRGTVGLVMPAPEGGGVVILSTDNPSLVEIPASVSIAPGNSANSFTINTRPVETATSVRINATAGGVTKSAFMDLAHDPNAPPALLSVTLSVSGVTGGNSVPGTIFLNANAPAGGASVTLATSNSSVAQAPPVVNIPAGQGWANFTITTFPVSANTQVTITGFYGGSTKSANLTVMAGASQPSAPGTPTLLSPANDASVSQPITLDWSDASNAVSYEIQVDDRSSFSAPLVRNLTSTASQTTVTGLSTSRHWWRVRARNSAGVAGNWSSSRRFRPQSVPSAASLSTISVSPSSVVGGNSSQGTVTLSTGAPSGGAVVSISSSIPSVASVPASVTVPSGATSASFTVATSPVSANSSVNLTASYNGVTRTGTLTVTPVPPPAALSSISLNPTSVTGGNNSQGTVTLTSPAPSGGIVVTLSSSSPDALTPASITVPSGVTSANFSVATRTVASSTSAIISGEHNGVARTATLAINPVASGPLPAPSLVIPSNDARFSPGQNITFDWSDVSGASNYTLQIDDDDEFPSPSIVNQITTASHYSSNTLPTRTMWWRVRANDGSSNPGNWSSIRRVEVKD